MIHLDPRTKLLLLCISNLVLFCHVSLKYECMMMIVILSLFFLSNKTKIGIKFAIIYFIFYVLDILDLPNNVVLSFLLMFSNTIRMMLPIIAMGTYTFSTTKTSEMTCALRKMHVSENIIIPLVVMIRFFPTAKEDYTHIKEAMTLRGIETSILHPLQSLEYILIPLLMNSTVVANDLTIAALTKGLSIEAQHTSIAKLYLSIFDIIYPILLCIPLLFFWKGDQL